MKKKDARVMPLLHPVNCTNPILVDPVEEEAVSVNFQRDWNANAGVLWGSYVNVSRR